MWKERIAGFAAKEIAKLPHSAGTNAEVIIDSGSVPELLNRAAEQAKADLPVVGHISTARGWAAKHLEKRRERCPCAAWDADKTGLNGDCFSRRK